MIRKLIIVCLLLFSSNLFAATYYIDPDHPSASNSNNGTSASTPWAGWYAKFWDSNTAIGPDDIIYVAGHTYTEKFAINSTTSFSGSSGHPISIRPYAGYAESKNVIIDGTAWAGGSPYAGFYVSGDHDYVELDGDYDGGTWTFQDWTGGGITSDGTSVKTGWVFNGFTIKNCWYGGKFLNFGTLTVSNFSAHDLSGSGVERDDLGFALRSGCGTVTFKDGEIYNITDGGGGSDTGDGDGLASTVIDAVYGAVNVTVDNVDVYNVSEDGIDLRVSGALVIKNSRVHDAIACGIKTWEGTSISLINVASYHNGEDGIKTSNSTGTIWHLTSVGNFENGLQIRSTGSNIDIKNSILVGNGEEAVKFDNLDVDADSTVDFVNCDLYGSSTYALVGGANGYPYSDVTDGDLNTALSTGWTAGNGTISGSMTNSISSDPGLLSLPVIGKSSRWGDTTTTTTSIALEVYDNNWPTGDNVYAIGDEIETALLYQNDGVLRQLTAVDNDNHIITFANDALASAPADGVRVVNWGQSPPATRTFALEISDASSNIVDVGVADETVHCTEGTCDHFYYGTNPDIGYYEWAGESDTTDPIVAISDSDPKTLTSGYTTTLGFTSSDASGIDECKWRSGSAPDESNGTLCTGTTSGTCSVTGLVQGNNSIYVGCADPTNNWGSDNIVVNAPSYRAQAGGAYNVR